MYVCLYGSDIARIYMKREQEFFYQNEHTRVISNGDDVSLVSLKHLASLCTRDLELQP